MSETGICCFDVETVDYREDAMRPWLMRMMCVAVAMIGLSPVLGAGTVKNLQAPLAPVPAQIGAAKKVFIANGGGAALEDSLGVTIVKGGPDRAYNQFYSAVKGLGRYDVVDSPADADLVLQISFTLGDGGTQFFTKNTPFSAALTPAMGQVRLVVIDPKTRIPLWTIVEYVQAAVLGGNRERNFDSAMSAVVGRLKSLAERPPAGASQ